jgi:hypothetical protein
MAEMTVLSDVEAALRKLWEDGGSYSVLDEEFNEKIKTHPISTLIEMGFNLSKSGFTDDHTVVVIDKDPYPGIQHNDEKARNWKDEQDKYILKIPKPETDDEYAAFADYLVYAYGAPVKGGITAEGL